MSPEQTTDRRPEISGPSSRDITLAEMCELRRIDQTQTTDVFYGKSMAMIVAALVSREPLRVPQIRDKLLTAGFEFVGKPNLSVRDGLRRAEKQGLVSKHDVGLWGAPPKPGI
jgi:hypothetical protein